MAKPHLDPTSLTSRRSRSDRSDRTDRTGETADPTPEAEPGDAETGDAGTGNAAGPPDRAAAADPRVTSTATAPDTAVSGGALAAYLRTQATEFLRALRQHRDAGGPGPANGSAASADAARALCRSARRISGSLHTFQAHLDADWSESMRAELAWVSATLALEHAYASRLERLLHALYRLSGAAVLPQRGGTPEPGSPGRPRPAAGPDRGNLTVGAAKAGALLERRLTLARTRAHSTALQALGGSRFHAVADQVAVLAGEVPLARAAAGGGADLRPSARAAEERLAAAVADLPPLTECRPYDSGALVHGLSPDPAPHPQDAPWHQVRLLLRLHRYAREVLLGGYGTHGGPGETSTHGTHGGPGETSTHDASNGTTAVDRASDIRLRTAGRALDRHRDASEAAAAAAHAARIPRITPATAYALGVLHADQRHEAEAARYAFQRCWPPEQSVSSP